MGSDHLTTQLTIDALAQENRLQQERIVSLESDVNVYRQLAQQSIHALAEMTQEMDRANRRHIRLREEVMLEAMNERQVAA